MKPELAEIARRVLGREAGESASPERVAIGAANACEQLTQHFSRLIGRTGMRLLFDRSVLLARHEYPWLPRGANGLDDDACSALADALAQHDPGTATAAFVAVWATVVELLGRFIGDALVARLLTELWPEISHHAPSSGRTEDEP
jgi:hypothetical protein